MFLCVERRISYDNRDFNKYYFGTPKLRDYDLQMVDGGRLVIWHSKDHNLLSEKKADSWRIPSSVERDLVIKHHRMYTIPKFETWLTLY